MYQCKRTDRTQQNGQIQLAQNGQVAHLLVLREKSMTGGVGCCSLLFFYDKFSSSLVVGFFAVVVICLVITTK